MNGSNKDKPTDLEDISDNDMLFDDTDSDESGSDSNEAETLKSLLRESEDKHLRLLAEFDNFRKNNAKQRQDLLKYEGERIFVELLEVVDNFELALNFDNNAQSNDIDGSKFKEGISLIHKKMIDFLSKWGVKGESGVGKPFDPTIQNAISRVPLGDAEPNTVVAELKKAYFYKDKLIRVAEVVVAGEG